MGIPKTLSYVVLLKVSVAKVGSQIPIYSPTLAIMGRLRQYLKVSVF